MRFTLRISISRKIDIKLDNGVINDEYMTCSVGPELEDATTTYTLGWRDMLRIVLVRTRNPLNIGAVARAMANFGFTRLRLVAPYDPAFREARSALGGEQILANASVYDTVPQAVGDCIVVVGTTNGRGREVKQELRNLPAVAESIQELSLTGPVAILFGSEKNGLNNEDLSHCHWLLRIPTTQEHPSMNLAQSVGIVLYELVRKEATTLQIAYPEVHRQRETAAPANIQALQRLTAALTEALRISGYVKPRTQPGAEEKLRQVIHRMRLSQGDAETWMGILRQILWKLRRERS